jgi:hypothetical protein
MAELYGLNDELPAEFADLVLDDEKPVGPPDDEDTATVDEEDAQ